MAFNGIPIFRWDVPWNSIKLRKFHGRWSDTKFHGTLGPLNGLSPSSIELHEIPWNSGAAKCNITQFHGIPWNFEIVILINTMLSRTSMGYTMEFRGTLEWPNKKITEFHGIPWNKEGAITNDTGVPWNSMEYSMEFHGTLVPPNDRSLSSMEFHGTFHGIPWNFGVAKWSIT